MDERLLQYNRSIVEAHHESVPKKEKRSSSKADSIRQEIYSLGNYFDVASHKRHPILDDWLNDSFL